MKAYISNAPDPIYSCSIITITGGNPLLNCDPQYRIPTAPQCVISTTSGVSKLTSNSLIGSFCYNSTGLGSIDSNINTPPINIDCDPRIGCDQIAVGPQLCNSDIKTDILTPNVYPHAICQPENADSISIISINESPIITPMLMSSSTEAANSPVQTSNVPIDFSSHKALPSIPRIISASTDFSSSAQSISPPKEFFPFQTAVNSPLLESNYLDIPPQPTYDQPYIQPQETHSISSPSPYLVMQIIDDPVQTTASEYQFSYNAPTATEKNDIKKETIYSSSSQTTARIEYSVPPTATQKYKVPDETTTDFAVPAFQIVPAQLGDGSSPDIPRIVHVNDADKLVPIISIIGEASNSALSNHLCVGANDNPVFKFTGTCNYLTAPDLCSGKKIARCESMLFF